MSNKNKSKYRVVVILGMHRSGTSALTRSLSLLGVDLGDNLIPGIKDNNEKGFFEDVEINSFNNELLIFLNSSWDHLALIDEEVLLQDRLAPFKMRACEILRAKIGGRPFGIKDPRIARLLPFWNDVFDHLDLEVNYIIAVRHPISVAQSLHRRDDFVLEKGYYLWMQHVLLAVQGSSGYKRIVVDFDLLMGNAQFQLSRISKAFDLPFDNKCDEFLKYDSEFLEDRLRHTKYEFEDLSIFPEIPHHLYETYDLMLRFSRNEEDINSDKSLKEFNLLFSGLQSMRPALAYMASMDVGLKKREERIAQLNQDIAHRDQNIELEKLLEKVLQSNSWRITKPFRFIRRNLASNPLATIRPHAARRAHSAWHTLPLSTSNKQKLKNTAFSYLSFLFRQTESYQRWKKNGLYIKNDLDIDSESLNDHTSDITYSHESTNQYIPRLNTQPFKNYSVKLICFYLPQFHPIPENDAWWGDGFTEWTNVKPAAPQFEGHYQPHVPGELAYYNLLDPSVQHRQVELAKLYGIGGFCFYFYWFGGKRLLEKPIENYLNDKSLDLPFCLCWANENWSRRWDGLDSELLIAQQYSPEDDLAFIEHVAQYMHDSRYIRINGKPLLIVYRPNLLPSARDTAERWRNWCSQNGIGPIYLAYTQSFENVDPAVYGFDAAIEFPPNNSSPPDITDHVVPIVENFQSTVYDWRIFVKRSEAYHSPDYMLFRSVCPSWDNTARRKNKGTIFHHASPKLFTEWLTNAFVDTMTRIENKDEQIVFVNAWNEWAEGAHLEPDLRYGYAWLQAIRDAHQAVMSRKKRIVVVAHDAHPHGAQILCLNIVRYFKEYFSIDVDLIMLGEGPLTDKYAQYATVHQLNLDAVDQASIDTLLDGLRKQGAQAAIVNTAVAGNIIPHLNRFNFDIVTLVHEMPGVLKEYGGHGLNQQSTNIANMADRIVFAAEQVKEGFESFLGRSVSQAVIRPQGLYLRSLLREGIDKETVRTRVRQKLGLPKNARIIMCAGYADHRKGFDFFVRACMSVIQRLPNTYALWVGHLDQIFVDQSLAPATAEGIKERFIFTGLVEQPQEYFLAADLYALTSREDPFPSVVMEALDALTPVVAFRGCGGFENLLKRDCGVLVPPEDTEAFAEALIELLQDPQCARMLAETGRNIVETELSFRHYLFDLMSFARLSIPKVSVVVPNYNYEKYIRQRLDTVAHQTYPIFELIVLDDCSPDNSVAVIQEFLKGCQLPHRLEINEHNSGSVFRQWQKGVEMARGDLIWIAEADDLAEPEFLERLVPFFNDPKVVLAYTQSKQIDENDNILADDYLAYTNDVGEYWRQDYVVAGQQEIKRALCIKNTIPNVSGVLFRRTAINDVLTTHGQELIQYRVAGDWLLYLRLAMMGNLAFSANSLNLHRRHIHSVTQVHNHLDEVISLQAFAAQLVDLDESQLAAISAYQEKLRDHFAQAEAM